MHFVVTLVINADFQNDDRLSRYFLHLPEQIIRQSVNKLTVATEQKWLLKLFLTAKPNGEITQYIYSN